MANGNGAAAAAPAPENEAAAGGVLSQANLKYLLGVVIAGAVGGLLYWVLAHFTGTTIPGNFGPAGAIFALMFVGAVAGAIGVYLLTASDPTAIRTYIFAMVCGLMWQPVIASGERIVTDATATSQNSAAAQATQDVQTATNTNDPSQINAAVQKSVPAVTAALDSSTSVTDTQKKTEIADTSKQAINTFQTAAAKSPEAPVEAISSVSLHAANSGQAGVAVHGVQALNAIAIQAEHEHNNALVQKIQQKLLSLAEQSKDTTVQSSARTAAAQLHPTN